MSHLDLVSDHSKEKLVEVPENLLDMSNLKMLFLEGNFLSRLPDDIFWRLPMLMWLDLRNNLIEAIPRSIANHQHLENLLLTNNNIERLPDELGLLPKLKALQVAENPLLYPPKKVVIEGTKTIKDYLKSQYELEHRAIIEELSEGEANVDDKEEMINIHEPNLEETEERIIQRPQNVLDSIKNRLADPLLLRPTINVSRILNPHSQENKEDLVKIIHKVSRKGSKISLKSSINNVTVKKNHTNQVIDNSLKEGWLNQLRILLTDQERIIQQERNLRALTDWRVKKKSETPKVFREKRSPPFAVYEQYSKMPTREQLLMQLNNFFKESGIERADKTSISTVNIEKLINDLMQQLQEMEVMYDQSRTPRSEIEEAGKQIKMVMDIQKKLLQLKTSNESYL